MKQIPERILKFVGALQRKAHEPKKPASGPIYGDVTNRLFAVVIDLILLLPIALLPSIYMKFSTNLERSIYVNSFQAALLMVYTIPFIYKLGATPGKILLGLKVVDNITGAELTLSQTIIRCLAYITAPLGLFSAAARKDKRSWHDFIAGTRVIYSPNRWYKRHLDSLKARVKAYFKR